VTQTISQRVVETYTHMYVHMYTNDFRFCFLGLAKTFCTSYHCQLLVYRNLSA